MPQLFGPARRVGTGAASAAALLFASFLPPAITQNTKQHPCAVATPLINSQNALKTKRLRIALRAKLTKVPVFMVTNEAASPYLSQLPTGDQTALMFLYPTEADRMLQGVQKAPNAAGAKIHVTNLDRAFRLALREPRLSGLRDQTTNRELTMVWQFMPNGVEMRNAQSRLVKSLKVSGSPKIPAYMVEGLVYNKRGKEIRPVFLSASDADEAVSQLVQQTELGSKPAVEVLDLMELLVQLEEDIIMDPTSVEAELSSLEFVPPSESTAFQRKLESDKVPLQARVFPPTRGLLG